LLLIPSWFPPGGYYVPWPSFGFFDQPRNTVLRGQLSSRGTQGFSCGMRNVAGR
jgi:hypothetical protein